jgi:hypothetical protein
MAAKERSDQLLDVLLRDGPSTRTYAEAADAVNHADEDAYWRESHRKEPYYKPEHTYDDYAPAYRMGWESRAKYDDGTFDRYEPAFRNDWQSVRGNSRLDWQDAKHAVRAAWMRMEQALPTLRGGGRH